MKTNLITNKNTKKPVVSVIIPVFNGAHFLEETVRSVQKSTYKRFEILLVDDGSTDHSKKVCKKLTKRYRNVRFYNFPRNRGLGRVLNFALQKAKGEYICRINQDDLMLPYRIATQATYLTKQRDVVAVGSSIILFNNDGFRERLDFIKQNENIRKIWLALSPFSDPAVMYRKADALAVGGYDQKFWPADDVHLWFRIGRRGKLANIPRPLTHVRLHDEAASVKYFRIDTKRTFKLHLWANEFVSSAPWYVWLFWVCQFVAGMTFSPQFNWRAYRWIKRFIKTNNSFQDRFAKYFQPNKRTNNVTAHPAKLKISGV